MASIAGSRPETGGGPGAAGPGGGRGLGLTLLVLLLTAAALISPPGLGLFLPWYESDLLYTPALSALALVSSICLALLALVYLLATVLGGRSIWFSLGVYLPSLLLFAAGCGIFQLISRSPPAQTQSFELALYDGRRYETRRLAFNLNKQGFRSPLDYQEIKDRRGNVLLLGDSFIFGVVDQEETIDSILMRDHFQAGELRFLNAGVPGTSLLEYEHAARAFQEFRLDRVFVGIYVDNDLVASPVPALAGALEGFLQRFAVLRHLANFLSQRRVRAYHETHRSMFEGALGDEVPIHKVNLAVFDRIRRVDQADYDLMQERFLANPAYRESLLRIREMFPRSEFCLLLFPSKYQVSEAYIPLLARLGYRPRQVISAGIQEAITDWARGKKLPAIDFTNPFREYEQTTNQRLYYFIDDHMNETANQIVARRLREALTAAD